jgi:hypothetical protein
MLYTIELITVSRITIEAESDTEAKYRADNFVKEYNSHHHHGEETAATVTFIPYKQVIR